MARLTGDNLNGIIDNLVFYTMGGVNYVRKRPGKRTKKKGEISIMQINRFSIISKYGSSLLTLLKRNFLFAPGLAVYNRFRGWLNPVFAARFDQLVWDIATDMGSCQLNSVVNLQDILRTNISVSDTPGNSLKIGIPAMNPVKHLNAPPYPSKVNFNFYAASSAFGSNTGVDRVSGKTYSIDYKDQEMPAQDIMLDLQAAPGDIVVVVLSINFESLAKDRMQLLPEWLPAAVIAIGRKK